MNTILPFQRPDYRKEDELRHITIEPNFAANAHGSVLISFDKTKVICSAIFEKKIPRWMQVQNVEGGWITAEYSMLPYSTEERKVRESSQGKVEGRTVEIQRLIGRALRAVTDLKKLPGYTLWIDCDVLQADGGTRTASVNGAYIAAQLAVRKLMKEGLLKESPFTDSVAGVSVGIFQSTPILDLNYLEDKDAEVDFNVIMTGSGKFVELQAMGEEACFSDEDLGKLLVLAKKGILEITKKQNEVLKIN
ncbi:MAG: ribonuclease PH [Verrucomicrobia bacterium]|nr:MAG: ribonuclease PH [Verrucomicrobiota bacterium]